MFLGSSSLDTRRFFIDSWQKYQNKSLLQPLEQQVVDVILQHPEYHSFLNQWELENSNPVFTENENPFWHLGLHLAIREQIATNRPAGITQIYQSLLTQNESILHVEHKMMECLALCLWEAHQNKVAPNENNYLLQLKRIC